MQTITDLLDQQPVTKGLAHEIRAMIAGCAKNVAFQAGEYIFREAEPADYFYLIRRGKVALEIHAPGRGPLTFLMVNSGEMLGASWLVPPYRWAHDARVVEHTRAIAFDCVCLRDKCEADPRVGYELFKRFIPPLVERLQNARLQSLDLNGRSPS